ncbi:TetR family transcriptional regulator [Streptomyces sp. XM4193]|uniref:TetR/AcrR family transcriptional regulator n=1 Tax=Streptomyces sp. XM4193 TaxID=2929782 RepID=UPI001FF7A7C2|nr:TetR family transcriptional regulator [Streptomyces sp. XM4193]MCK1798435.1 TetR family transcriptional regulator [Streptomyces sp. XM4193]
MTGKPSAGSAARENDRAAAILHAALEVIATRGVHRTTHRRIAETAGVSLGLSTYHFANLDEIIERAFALLVETMSVQYRAELPAAPGREEAIEAVVRLICGPEYATDRELTLMFELYACARHNPKVASLTVDWLARSHSALAPHFGERACLAIDALIEGWTIHRTFQERALDRETVRAAITALSTL